MQKIDHLSKYACCVANLLLLTVTVFATTDEYVTLIPHWPFIHACTTLRACF